MKNPCVQDIIDKAAGKISEREAGKALRDLTNKAKAISARDGVPLSDAAKQVIDEAVKFEALNAALSKRATLMNLKALGDFQDFVKDGISKGRLAGKAAVDYMVLAFNAYHERANRVKSGLVEQLKEAKVFNEFKKGGTQLSKDVTTERWHLSVGDKPVTGNPVAQKIAEIIVGVRNELNAYLRKSGANIRDDQNYAGMQTHDSDLMRRAGIKPGIKAFFFGKEDINASFKAWRESLDGLNIDWVKTNAGTTDAERESFLRAFFDSVYTGVHGTVERTDPKLLSGRGSLVEKINSQRLLWFADPESQWKYNQQWGIRDFNMAILHEIDSAVRMATMLQYFGASPEKVFKEGVKQMAFHVREAQLSNAQEHEASLEAKNIQGSFDLLSGKAGTTRNPWRALFFDHTRNFILAAKSGSTLFSMFGDPANFNSELSFQGMAAADRFTEVLKARAAAKTPEGQAALRALGFMAHAMSGIYAERWDNAVRPNRTWSSKLSQWSFDMAGVTGVTDIERRLLTMMTGHHMGEMSHLPFDGLPERYRSILEHYHFTPKEWDVVRGTTYTVGEGYKVVSQDRLSTLPDDVIDTLLPEKLRTPFHRDNMRNQLEGKVGAFIQDRVLSGVPTPGLREKELMTLHATPRGDWWRELASMFFTFKGFSTTVAMRNAEKFGIISQSEGYKPAFFHISSLVAQTAVLGYVGITIRDLIRGKEPRKLAQDGTLNWKLFLESMQAGGGAGIYGDYLFNEYDTQSRGFFKTLAGPVLGEAEPFFTMLSKGRKSLYDENGERIRESLGGDIARFAQGNIPVINLFYTKFFFDQYIMWNIKEALSPGILRRTQKFDRDQNWQEWWIDPAH